MGGRGRGDRKGQMMGYLLDRGKGFDFISGMHFEAIAFIDMIRLLFKACFDCFMEKRLLE